MAIHTEDTLRRAGVTQILDLPLAIPAFEAVGAKGLVAGEDCWILDLVTTAATAVRAIVANQGAIPKQQEVRIGIEEGITGIAAKAVNMPPVSRCIESAAVLCK